MRQEKHILICDNCEKEIESKPLYGGHSAQGWLEVSQVNGSSCIRSYSDKDFGPWDFCCEKCLVNYMKNRLEA